MDCREAEKCISPYIEHSLDWDRQREFLQHIRGCQDCLEELELHYMLEVGLDEKDLHNEYDLIGGLEEELENAENEMQLRNRLQVVNAVLTTLAVVGIILCMGIQLSLWI